MSVRRATLGSIIAEMVKKVCGGKSTKVKRLPTADSKKRMARRARAKERERKAQVKAEQREARRVDQEYLANGGSMYYWEDDPNTEEARAKKLKIMTDKERRAAERLRDESADLSWVDDEGRTRKATAKETGETSRGEVDDGDCFCFC